MNTESIIKEVIEYSINFVEKPHPSFNNLPICPFAKKFRLANRIKYMVFPFLVTEPLDLTILLLSEVFVHQYRYDSYFVIHSDKNLDLQKLINFCKNLQRHVDSMDLILFHGHPKDEFKIGEIYTRKEPYPGFQLLKKSLILESRNKLTSDYFANWSDEMLREVGIRK